MAKNDPKSSYVTPSTSSADANGKRLPSFQPPRDLSLKTVNLTNLLQPFGKQHLAKPPKKVYVPNLNVVRKKDIKASPPPKPQISPTVLSSGRGRGDSFRGNRGRGRGKLVQTQGVFSEGLAAGTVKPHGSHYGAGNDNKTVVYKPKLNLNVEVNKKHEVNSLNKLLNGNFVDDNEDMVDCSNVPLVLPLFHGVKQQMDCSNMDSTFEALQRKIDGSFKEEKKETIESAGFWDVLSKSEKEPQLLCLKLPNRLPKVSEVGEPKKPKLSPDVVVDKMALVKAKRDPLKSLGEGYWGTLRIHKDGTTSLVIDDKIMPMVLERNPMGEALFQFKTDKRTNERDLINLGSVEHLYACGSKF